METDKLTEEEKLSKAANIIRGLSMDAIQKANSGHPGLPLGMADVAAVLWLKHLNVSSKNPSWVSRDRFVLSGGHGSAMLYSLLHLSGYKVSMDDLKNFRQFGSCTPGHPELGVTDGVEVTTGPLGQGLANGVGLAMAEKMLSSRFNTADKKVFDNFTYVFCGDGDMMEGISHEAASMAGNLKLEKLVVFYDSNKISIEGDTDTTFTDDTAMRFKSYGWRVLDVDGHDISKINKAIVKAKKLDADGKPTLIVCHTTIGKGSPNKAGKACSHGEPLGVDEVKLTKQALGLPEEDFYVSEDVLDLFKRRQSKVNKLVKAWKKQYDELMKEEEFKRKWDAFFDMSSDKIDLLKEKMPTFTKGIATRAASGEVIQVLAKELPNLCGGSADLGPSNKTWIKDEKALTAGDFSGKNIHFGVRELGMGAIQNGMIAYGGLRVYIATFFVFSDYIKPAIRVAAISEQPAVYVFSHDSFYVGEDGPTHEPIEQLASLRSIPNITVIRPADAAETSVAWLEALKNAKGPTAILVTRQNLELIDRTEYPSADELSKGAYVMTQTRGGTPDVVLIATGSEVSLALNAAKELHGVNVRVVNMPSWELFEKQPASYKREVLPTACTKRVAIEAGSSFGWQRYIGLAGMTITLDTFGASAPYKVLEKQFGFTVENIVSKVKTYIDK